MATVLKGFAAQAPIKTKPAPKEKCIEMMYQGGRLVVNEQRHKKTTRRDRVVYR